MVVVVSGVTSSTFDVFFRGLQQQCSLVCGERRKPNKEIGYIISFNGCSNQGDLEGACKQHNDCNYRGWFVLVWTCLKPCNTWVCCFVFPLQNVIAMIYCCGVFFFFLVL
jgi:hypothetical protein